MRIVDNSEKYNELIWITVKVQIASLSHYPVRNLSTICRRRISRGKVYIKVCNSESSKKPELLAEPVRLRLIRVQRALGDFCYDLEKANRAPKNKRTEPVILSTIFLNLLYVDCTCDIEKKYATRLYQIIEIEKTTLTVTK